MHGEGKNPVESENKYLPDFKCSKSTRKTKAENSYRCRQELRQEMCKRLVKQKALFLPPDCITVCSIKCPI